MPTWLMFTCMELLALYVVFIDVFVDSFAVDCRYITRTMEPPNPTTLFLEGSVEAHVPPEPVEFPGLRSIITSLQ